MSIMKNKHPWDLIVLKLRKELSPEQEIFFINWLNADNNRQLFQQLELVWENIQKKISVYEPDLEYYWKELSDRIKTPPADNRKHGTMKPLKIAFNRFLRVASIIFILFTATFFAAYYIGKNNSERLPQYITYSTLNSKSKLFLPDSTEVWLHNNTSLTYNYNKKLKHREVDIAGEAFFKVKPDSKSPFCVSSNGVTVIVYGTQFNVNAYPELEKVRVSLYEGSVSMSTNDKNIFLTPGEEGFYDVKSKEISVTKGDVEFAKIWTENKIRFENKSLRDVCKYLSKWYGIKFDIDPAITDDQSFTFTFRGQSLDEVVGIMTRIQSFDYHIDEENKTVKIIKK